MNELVKLVAQKTNMPETVAKIAVITVLGAIKAKLPANVGVMLDTLLATSGTAGTATQAQGAPNANPIVDIGSIVGGLGSLLGKKS